MHVRDGQLAKGSSRPFLGGILPICRLSPPKTIISYLNDQASAASSLSSVKFIILARLLISMW